MCPLFILHPYSAAWVGQGTGESTELLSLENKSPPHLPRDAWSFLFLLPCPKIPQPRAHDCLFSVSVPQIPTASTNEMHKSHFVHPNSPLLPVLSVVAVLLAPPFSHSLLPSACCRTQSTQGPALFQSPEVPGYFRSFSLPTFPWTQVDKECPLCSHVLTYSPFLFFSVKT